jgi:hypothetical protein
VGNSDPNPATILEAMSWGLIPICTPQSGYHKMPGIINVSLNNVVEASKILWQANMLQEERLLELQAINFQALVDSYNYDRFASQVMDAIESIESPRIPSNPFRRALLSYYATTAYYTGSPLMELAARPGAPLRRFPALYFVIRFTHRKIRAFLNARYSH